MNLLPSQHAPASQALGTGTAAYATAVDSSDPAAQPSQRTRMRLAYLTTEYPAVSHTFIRRELLELERRGHTIRRLSIRPSKPDLPDPLDRAEREKTVAVLGGSKVAMLLRAFRFAAGSPLAFCRGGLLAGGMSAKSDRGLIKHVAYWIEAAGLMAQLRADGIEHVHVHFGTNAAAVGRLVRRMGGPSYSMTCHGPDEFDAVIGLDLAGKIADASFVVGISDFGAAQLKRWLSLDQWSKVHVVRCTVDEGFITGGLTPIPAAPRFVCIGRLAPQKGQLVLVDAVHRLKLAGVDIHVTLAGDGELRQAIECEIRDRDLTGHISITGWIGGKQVREHILASRAMVLPSFAEGLPVAIMEAMALGRPVISTYIAGIPELVVPGRNGWLVPSGRADLLAAALAQVAAASVDDLSAFAGQARSDVSRMHSTTVEVDRLIALFMAATSPRAKSSSELTASDNGIGQPATL